MQRHEHRRFADIEAQVLQWPTVLHWNSWRFAMIKHRNQDEPLKVGEDGKTSDLLPEATCTAFLQRPVSRSLGRD